MLICNIVDKLLDKDCLTNACASEKADLTALEVRTDKVDYLDTCFEYLVSGSLLFV